MNLVICIISTTLIIDHVQGIYHKDLLKSETVQNGNGLDPADYFRLKRQQKLKKRKRKYGKNNGLRASSSSGSSSKSKGNTPRAEFLIPERYEPPPPDCSGGDGTLSGMTMITFLMSAVAVASNVISNINSNQRNNNNNNNDNNDNVFNGNFANNNNAGNNMNVIQICKYFTLQKEEQ